MEIAKEIQNIIPVFEKYPEVKLAYLFGSQATGKTGPLSDYDFAVYLDERDSQKRFDLRLKLMGDVSLALKTDDVDLIVLNDIEAPELKYAVLKDGILLLEREPFKLLVEPAILNEFFDFRQSLIDYKLSKAYDK